jgi:hypothetical protein
MTLVIQPQKSTRIVALTSLAVQKLTEEGLQIPSIMELALIVDCALTASTLLVAAALREVTDSEFNEMFSDFVLRATNRAPGVGDVLPY